LLLCLTVALSRPNANDVFDRSSAMETDAFRAGGDASGAAFLASQ
jgi:hypothetical protein